MSYEPHEFDEQEWVVGVELEDLVHHGAPPGVDHVQKPVLLVIREAELDGVTETKLGRMLKSLFQTRSASIVFLSAQTLNNTE